MSMLIFLKIIFKEKKRDDARRSYTIVFGHANLFAVSRERRERKKNLIVWR
jgi:hypothetical protein